MFALQRRFFEETVQASREAWNKLIISQDIVAATDARC